MQNEKSRSRLRTEHLYEILRDQICMLEFAPGEKLSEDQLANRFGVSRTPIRSVINMLIGDQLVESRHGVGTFVTEVKFSRLEDVYHMRMELAVLIGRLSPKKAGDDVLSKGRHLTQKCRELAEKPEVKGFAEIHLKFFWLLASLIGNEVLRELTVKLQLQTTRIWLLLVPKDLLSQEIMRFSREMEDILDALALGDISNVGYLLRTHIAMSFTRLKQYEACMNVCE